MTNDEFTILDELYFVTKYANLQSSCEEDLEGELNEVLVGLIEKDWVSAMASVDEKLKWNSSLKENLPQYFFLATKKGLLAHNS